MIYFHWIYLLLYIAIMIPAIITVLMDNRQPAKTMAWILVLSFMPFVGIIFYDICIEMYMMLCLTYII